jgi:hypothetical protein
MVERLVNAALVLTALVWLGMLSVVFAQQNGPPETLKENSVGRLWWNGGNELLMDSKIPDASKFRIGAPWQAGESGGGGGLSFDIIGGIANASPQRRIEAVLFVGSMDNHGGGELSINLLKRGTWANITDAAQIKIMEATSDLIEFKAPVRFSGGVVGGTITAATDYIASPSGRFRTYQQDDGNLVQYEVISPSVWCPRWSSWTGVISNDSWPSGSPCR